MKYLLGVFAVVFVLIASIFWVVNSGGPEPNAPVENAVVLTEYADTSAKVVYELHGELVGEGERQSIRITIDRNQRLFEVLDGYQQKVMVSKSFPNNAAAFEEFGYGLSRAGFVLEQYARFETEKGVCPNGNITIYKLVDAGEDVSRLWGSTCSEKDGSFDGNRRVVKDLFEDQIPEYRDLARDVNL